MPWYCFRTRNKKERQASCNVAQNLGVEVFCPRISRVKVTRLGEKRFTEAMFPCYAFAQVYVENQLVDLNYTQGVSHIVQFGDHIPVVADTFIAELRQDLGHDDTLFVEKLVPAINDRVHVEIGPLRHTVGTIIRAADGRERVRLLVELLGRSVLVNIETSKVSVLV